MRGLPFIVWRYRTYTTKSFRWHINIKQVPKLQQPKHFWVVNYVAIFKQNSSPSIILFL